MNAIDVSGLTKEYGEVLANDDVSFSVGVGEVFGYLGPNGAGKTTTIRTLLGFQTPTAGTASLLGADVHDERALVEAKRRIGYLPANPAFDEESTGRAVLDLHAAVKGDTRRDELLELFEVPLDRKVRSYSTGQKQKLGLVQAFMHDPELVIMDEPTSGLDPLMQQRFNEFVRDEKERGTTIFLSSHVLTEVRSVCDRIAIIRDGRLVTVERVEDLLGRSGKSVLVRTEGTVEQSEVTLAGVHDLSIRQVSGVGTEAVVGDGSGGERARETGGTELSFTFTGDVNELVDFIDRYDLLELDVEEAPLEDVFMRFYGDDDV
ncbi:ABC transporter ATP-binding protein [Haloarchaeobius sp. TZWWS8]|uniref:ABC transporter ATP-binding protein n=1 Tax=Haloarchaeobius sp. TZWWS8 TaxID=3446121 RepID=UPI003EBF8490